MTMYEVMEAMGDCATDAEARAMLDLLQQQGLTWAQAQSLPEDEWLQLLAAAVAAAKEAK